MKKTFKYIFAVLITFTSVNVFASEIEPLTHFNLCETNALNTFRVIGYAIFVVKIIVPLIIIVLAFIELGKIVINGDDQGLIVSAKKLIVRIILGVAIFILPSLLLFIINLVTDDPAGLNGGESDPDSFYKCTECLLNPLDKSKCATWIEKVDNPNSSEGGEY